MRSGSLISAFDPNFRTHFVLSPTTPNHHRPTNSLRPPAGTPSSATVSTTTRLVGKKMSSYENVVGGKLKLKGKALDVKAGGVKKKKKHKKEREQINQVIEHDLSAAWQLPSKPLDRRDEWLRCQLPEDLLAICNLFVLGDHEIIGNSNRQLACEVIVEYKKRRVIVMMFLAIQLSMLNNEESDQEV
ncbi:hypothetical protein QYF36_010278 [Acer negundo]|nr:hypothetical protein QYF36_010278 [Acer negundo]